MLKPINEQKSLKELLVLNSAGAGLSICPMYTGCINGVRGSKEPGLWQDNSYEPIYKKFRKIFLLWKSRHNIICLYTSDKRIDFSEVIAWMSCQ